MKEKLAHSVCGIARRNDELLLICRSESDVWDIPTATSKKNEEDIECLRSRFKIIFPQAELRNLSPYRTFLSRKDEVIYAYTVELFGMLSSKEFIYRWVSKNDIPNLKISYSTYKFIDFLIDNYL